jgi:hypothetical protein
MVIIEENFALEFLHRKEGFTFLKDVRSKGPDKILRVKERSFYRPRKVKDDEGNYVKNEKGEFVKAEPRLECIPSNVKIRFGSGSETKEIVLKPHKPRQIIPLHAGSIMHHSNVNHAKMDMQFMASTILYLGDGRVQIHNPLKLVKIKYGSGAPKPIKMESGRKHSSSRSSPDVTESGHAGKERSDGGSESSSSRSSPDPSESGHAGKEQGLDGDHSCGDGGSKRSSPPSFDVSPSGHAAKKKRCGEDDSGESMIIIDESDEVESMTFKDKLKARLKELLRMKPDNATKALEEMEKKGIPGATFLAMKLCQEAKKRAKKSQR